MNTATLQYSTFHESFFERAITKILSIPATFGLFRTFFYKTSLSVYANLYLEVVGFEQQIQGDMNKDLAEKFIKTFTKIHKGMLNVQKNLTYTKDLEDFREILDNIINKLADCIEQLEDIVHPHYAYQISVNQQDNDWNNPLNDHWDNY